MNTPYHRKTVAYQEQNIVQAVTDESISCPDLRRRLAKIYEIAILRYNQSKSIDMANDASALTENVVLTHNAGKSGDEADG